MTDEDKPHPVIRLADPDCKGCRKIWTCAKSYKVYTRPAEVLFASKLRGCLPCSILYDAWKMIPQLNVDNRLQIKCSPSGFTGQSTHEIRLPEPDGTLLTAFELFIPICKPP
jgi:hypothetical protein